MKNFNITIVLASLVFSISDATHATREHCLKYFSSVAQVSEEQVNAAFEDECKSSRFFRKLAPKIHPDKCRGNLTKCHKNFLYAQTCKDLLRAKSTTKKAKETRNQASAQSQEKAAEAVAIAVGLYVFVAPCFFKWTQTACESWSVGCLWDNTAKSCLSLLFGKCGEAKEREACQKLRCKWGEISSSCS